MTDGRSLDALTAGDFRELEGTRFRLTASHPAAASIALEVELAAVAEISHNLPSSFRAPFTLSFHGPLTPVISQGIYRLEHERLGALDLFLVPVGPALPAELGGQRMAMCYEAVFG